MATPRGTRSRISSPFGTAPNNALSLSSDSMGEGHVRAKTMLDRWIEPPLPQPRPSFMDAGMARQGVVANMAALGTRPSAKIMKSAIKSENMDGGLVNAAKDTSAASTPAPAEMLSTPEPVTTPDAARRRSTSAKTDDLESAPRSPPQAPQQISLKKGISAAQKSGQSVFALAKSPLTAPVARETPPVAAPISVHSSTLIPQIGSDGQLEVNVELTDKVVEMAVQQALDRRRWPTAYALRTYYDDHRSDYVVVRLFEAIYGGYATQDQYTAFRSAIKDKKRDGRKDRTGEYYFNGDGSDPPPRPVFSAVNFAATYQTPSFQTPVYQTPYTPLGGSSSTGARSMSESQARRSPINSPSVPASPQYRGEKQLADGDGNIHRDEEHVSKKHKSNSFQVTNREVQLNGDTDASGNAARAGANGLVEGGELVSQIQQNGSSEAALNTIRMGSGSRSRSMSSSSSLSSLDEAVLEDGITISPAKQLKRSVASDTDHNAAAHGPLSVSTSAAASEYSPAGMGALASKLLGGQQSQLKHSSPYASAEAFAAAAETAGLARPTRHALKRTGPKMHFFSHPTPQSAHATPPQTAGPPTTPTPAGSSSSSLPSNSTTTTNNLHANALSAPPSTTSDQRSSMAPAAILDSSNPASCATTSTAASATALSLPKKGKLGAQNISKALSDLHEPDRARRKLQARETTARRNAEALHQEESNERHQLPLPPELDLVSDGGDSVTTKRSSRRTAVLRAGRGTRQRVNYDSEDPGSPTLLTFHPDLPLASLSTSRAGTPNNFNRPARKAKTGTGLRVKTSPMKKKGGTLAGIPRASGERNSPIGGSNGIAHNQDDNDDYCSACGGNGDLVCCDGCTRSFHFKCVDPPIIEGSLPDEWFCNVCQSNRFPRREDEDTPFGILLSSLERKNPVAFHLPKPIREYFVDVKTGTEGEYEESLPPKPKKTPGYDNEQPDYFRLKDVKGKTIFCHQCNGTASPPDRMIIPCSYCNMNWHLDCLPNPLAKEPTTTRQWRCPLHVDDLLIRLPETLAPAHRFRKVKGQPSIKPAFKRGVRNNGHIEIENDPTDDEEEQGFFDLREYGHVYKLPEHGIKLDFIAKVKEQGGGRIPHFVPRPKYRPNIGWNQRDIAERQAALNLASLASQDPDLGSAHLLINTLLAEAPPAVLALLAQGDAEKKETGKLTKNDKQQLIALKALIERQLAASDDQVETHTPNGGIAVEVSSADEDTAMAL